MAVFSCFTGLRKAKIFFLFSLLPCLGALSDLVWAKSDQPVAASVREGGTFVFRVQAEPETLDWNLAHTPIETQILTALMEGLVRLDKDMKVIPGLAQSWTVSPDRKVITFTLRNDAKWSDGVSVRAQDFVASWKRLLDPKTAAPYAYFLFDIVGAKQFNEGTLADFNKVCIKALDSRRLQVQLNHPVSHWLHIPSFWVTFPIREELIAKHRKRWTAPGKLVTTGPFVLTQHEADTKIVMERNPHYYQNSLKPKGEVQKLSGQAVSKMIGQIVSDDSTALSLYLSGKIHFLTDVPSFDLKRLKSRKDLYVFPYLKTVYLGFVTTHPLLSDIHVRKAIAQAINRSQLGKILAGEQKEASSLVPPPLVGSASKNGEIGLAYNPIAAKTELSLRAKGLDIKKPIQALLLNWDKSLIVMQYIQQELKKNLGLTLDLEPFDNKTYRSELNLRKFPLFLTSWSADYPDPDNFLSLFFSTSGNNRTGWKSSVYDQGVLQARQMPDGAERMKKVLQLQKVILQENAIILPLYYEPNIALVSPRVKGLQLNPLNYVDFRGVTIGNEEGAKK